MNGPRDKEESSGMKKVYLPLMMTLLAAFFTGLTWYSFAAAVQVRDEVNTQALNQEVNFNYSVTPKASALYPAPQPLSGNAKYFARVTDGLKMWVKADIDSKPDAQVKGTCGVFLKLQAGDLWERNYVLSPEKEFEGKGKFTVLNDTFNVPMQEILAFTKKVEEETQVYPEKGYTLNVTPVIKTKTYGADGQPLVNDFTPSFPFNLTQRELTPLGKLKQENKTALTSVNTLPGKINLFGLVIPVVIARYVFSTLAVLFICFAVRLFQKRSRGRQPLSEAQYINWRYRGRIVRARSGSIDQDLTVIQMDAFKELLKLAEERDKSIVCVNGNEDGKQVCRYYVLDGQSLYSYMASDELPGSKDFLPRLIDDRVIPKEGTTV